MICFKAIVLTLLVGNAICVPVSQIIEDDPLELQTLSLSFLPDGMEFDDVEEFFYESPLIQAKLSTSKVFINGLNTIDIKFRQFEDASDKKISITAESPSEIQVTGKYNGTASQTSPDFSMIPKEFYGAGAFKIKVKKPKIRVLGMYKEDSEEVVQFQDIQLKITFDTLQIEAENMKFGQDKKLVDWEEVNAMLNGSEYDEMWQTMLESLIHSKLMNFMNDTLKEMKISMRQLMTYAMAFASL